ADARTWVPMPYLESSKNIEPRLRQFEYLGDNRVRVAYEWIVGDTLDQDYHCFVHGISSESARAEDILFQQDHALPKPTTQWRKGEVLVDGPHELAIPDSKEGYDLVTGLFLGERLRLKGYQAGADRVLVARLKLHRTGGRISGITAESVTAADQPKPEGQADFAARLNPAGTWIDFGKVATDGSAKIERQPDRLVVFPYPRDRRFRVSLDLGGLAPSADPNRVAVTALAAGTGEPLGPGEFAWEKGRLVLTVGKPGAGRYAVSWK
ncbi:MAG: hypothetical protein ACYC6Y_20535, partial [Thermoguttaceae bacterium]